MGTNLFHMKWCYVNDSKMFHIHVGNLYDIPTNYYFRYFLLSNTEFVITLKISLRLLMRIRNNPVDSEM